MKTDECPLGDKIKLKFVLKGNEKVCFGHHEIQELGLIEIHEACKGCKFHNEEHAIVPSGFGPTSPPPPAPVSGPWQTGTLSVGPEFFTYAYGNSTYAYGNSTWPNNTSGECHYSMTPEEFEKFKKGEI